MYQFKGIEDTIVAIATPMGQGSIGVIRLSGRDSLSIVDKIFRSKSGKKPSAFRNYSAGYGWIIDLENFESVVDEVLVLVMRGPKSYTREDIVEISSHGGIVSIRKILGLVLDAGARMAEPGEFTKRAFINGRIDLTQAEAVLDIVEARTEAFLRMSTNQLKGELSVELETIREQLMRSYTAIEAYVNFPEDEVDEQGREDLRTDLGRIGQRVEKLLGTSEHGRILREGVKLVLCGKPNVGKSSLLNVLLKQPRAIVSDIAGTTRDTIEETAQIQGIPFQLVDTAGILEPRDLIEEEAVRRSHLNIRSADLVLLVVDSSQVLSSEDFDLMNQIKDQNVMVILNKVDLPTVVEIAKIEEKFPHVKIVKVSVLNKLGFEQLEKTLVDEVWQGNVGENQTLMVSNLRHINALKNCQITIEKSKAIIQEGLSLEFVSEEIKIAINFLDSITGRNIDDDLLETIFSQFCIGK